MIGVDISTNPWRRRKNSLHVSSISRFRPVPRGPRSMKPLTPPYISKEPQKKPLRLASSESILCLSLSGGVGCSKLLIVGESFKNQYNVLREKRIGRSYSPVFVSIWPSR